MSEEKFVCSSCRRTYPAARPRCMYCGAAVHAVTTMVVGPESGDVAASISAKIESTRALSPAEREARFQRAMDQLDAVFERGDPEAILIAMDAALELKAQPHLLLAKGQQLKAMGRHPHALEAIERALASEPSLPDAWFEKGDLLMRLGQPPAALAAFQRFLALGPSPAELGGQIAHARAMIAKLGG